jgi:hypothetical protein
MWIEAPKKKGVKTGVKKKILKKIIPSQKKMKRKIEVDGHCLFE